MSKKKPRKRAYIQPPNEVLNKKQPAPLAATASSRKASSASQSAARGSDWTYPEPSIKRTLRRSVFYFLMIWGLQYFMLGMDKGADPAFQTRLTQSLVVAVLITVIFLPFLHIMDKWSYNRWQRKYGSGAGTSEKSR